MNSTISKPTLTPGTIEVIAGTYFSYGLFGCFALSYTFGGWMWLLPAFFVMVLVPALDWIAGEDLTSRHAPSEGSIAAGLLGCAPHGFIIGYVGCIALLVSILARLTLLDIAFATLSLGVMGSIAITAAHELIHKSPALEKSFGRLGLASVCYLHFEIAHVRGHHAHAGTPLDESTARKNESLYSFVFRTVPRCFGLAWRLEAHRLAKRLHSAWSFDNLLLRFALLETFYLTIVIVFGGWSGLAVFLIQSAIAIFMLEAVSYVEHYGLVRQTLPNGRYRSMTPAHSWDSYHRFSNYLEFHLQRHADHHAAPTKSYSALQPHIEASPRLPAGYPVMVTLAMVPTLFVRVMDSRIPS